MNLSTIVRFGGIVAAFVITAGLLIVGFASAQAGFLLVGLLCGWPLLWAVTAWTVRGLRENYQLVPKGSAVRPVSRIKAPTEQY